MNGKISTFEERERERDLKNMRSIRTLMSHQWHGNNGIFLPENIEIWPLTLMAMRLAHF